MLLLLLLFSSPTPPQPFRKLELKASVEGVLLIMFGELDDELDDGEELDLFLLNDEEDAIGSVWFLSIRTVSVLYFLSGIIQQ